MVKSERVRKLNSKEYAEGGVLYWMNRDMRIEDNWALIFAQEKAREYKTTLSIVYNFVPQFLGGGRRQVDFKLGGLKSIEESCVKKNISFEIIYDNSGKDTPTLLCEYIRSTTTGLLVTDFCPLKISRGWVDVLRKKVDIPFFGVDAHNIVPVWITSTKQEFGAYTIRPKLYKLLPEYLEEFEKISTQKVNIHKKINWKKIEQQIETREDILPVSFIKPGEKNAKSFLKKFVQDGLHTYGEFRNDPNKDAQSNLSPYLHYGQISAARVVLDILKEHDTTLEKVISKYKNGAKEGNDSIMAFIEELVIRRELSDNFCFYNTDYDNENGFPDWAKKSHKKHAHDKREYLYTKDQFEGAQTHDDLWNACQNQMVKTGKMHGYMRMYWAKKILEWTKNTSDAMSIAIYLNDTYELDGRDPNGYAGIAWSIGGVHDRAWFERPVFGQIRYMNYNGCKSKFNVLLYIQKWS